MKRMLAAILAVLMLCCSAPAMAATKAHKHTGGTHANDGHCTVCGQQYQYGHTMFYCWAKFNSRWHIAYCWCGYHKKFPHTWRKRWSTSTRTGYRCLYCGQRKIVYKTQVKK